MTFQEPVFDGGFSTIVDAAESQRDLHDPLIGLTVPGTNLTIHRFLGAGGQAVALLCESPDGTPYVLKIALPEAPTPRSMEDPAELYGRWGVLRTIANEHLATELEVRTQLARRDSSDFRQPLSYGVTPSRTNFLVLPYKKEATIYESKVSLANLLRTDPIRGTCALWIGFVRIIDAMHGDGWSHLDIHPKNIVIDIDAKIPIMQPVDFGSSQRIGKPYKPAPGNPQYRHSELLSGNFPVCQPYHDTFSIGRSLLTFLEEICDAAPELQSPIENSLLEGIIAKALTPDRQRCFRSCGDLIEALSDGC